MDYKKPTSQMLGRFQPWHDGHTALFKEINKETGQTIIMVRSMPQSDNDPYSYLDISQKIQIELQKEGFTFKVDYDIIQVPNIVNIGYGRDVGYTIKQYDLGEEIHQISATKIRDANKH